MTFEAPFQDTIAALATPVGTSALAVLRVSGSECAALATMLGGKLPSPRVATRMDYRDLSGVLLDDTLCTFYKGPRSYTGEDLLEISCHGNPLVAQRVLADLLARGFRAAEPGEFTRRAFLNGRLDLSQAEAVIDLIHARSDRALEAANRQLRGGLGQVIEPLVEKLLEGLARIEAYIDFPDEDLPMEDRAQVKELLEGVLRGTNRLLATQPYGELLREGIKTLILGEPNAGKSSLLNRLLGRERALVSAEPGTTRDFIEERLMVGPHALRLIDTAGLNVTPGEVERMGIKKTYECAAEADLFLWVRDATQPLPTLPTEIFERMHSCNTLLVSNKYDLVDSTSLSLRAGLYGVEEVRVSALSGEGLEKLEQAVARMADAMGAAVGEDLVAINARHADALGRAGVGLRQALVGLERGEAIELISSEVRGALEALGEIAGRVDNERMLDHLFATFCIGK